jgi:hypothetical protein
MDINICVRSKKKGKDENKLSIFGSEVKNVFPKFAFSGRYRLFFVHFDLKF